MAQEEINKDLNSYIKERKAKSFWKKFTPKLKSKKSEEEIQAKIDAELKKDIERVAEKEENKIPAEDKAELVESEHKIETINEVEEEVEETIEREHENALKKFFKKLNFSKNKNKDEVIVIDDNGYEIKPDDEELKELLHGLHSWIIQLPENKLEEFKNSKEFELYTKYLRKHNLIK
ncbi:MAG: hypothetical protein ACP5N1_02010 [Candidatus Woesearchaeota archaeon]